MKKGDYKDPLCWSCKNLFFARMEHTEYDDRFIKRCLINSEVFDHMTLGHYIYHDSDDIPKSEIPNMIECNFYDKKDKDAQ